MPEPTAEVLIQLAEKVMGWSNVSDDLRGIRFWDSERRDYWSLGGNTAKRFCPHTDREQALDLLEAWCNKRPGRRWYRHEREVDGRHSLALFDASRVQLGAPTLPEAIVAAVCQAEGIGGE